MTSSLALRIGYQQRSIPSAVLVYLEALFELLGDKVEDYWIDAGIDGCHVDAEVVHY